MQGISREMLPRLMDKISDLCDNEDNIDYYIIEKLLIEECTELNPWLPIDENTPKDRMLLVATKGNEILVAIYREKYNKWLYRDWEEVFPTHYQELPPPKCNT